MDTALPLFLARMCAVNIRPARITATSSRVLERYTALAEIERTISPHKLRHFLLT